MTPIDEVVDNMVFSKELDDVVSRERDVRDDEAIFVGLAFERVVPCELVDQRPEGSVARYFNIDDSNLYHRPS